MDGFCAFSPHSHLYKIAVQISIPYLSFLYKAKHQFKVGGNSVLKLEVAETFKPDAFYIEGRVGRMPSVQECSTFML